MNGLKNTKYMRIGTNIGCIIAVLCIIYYTLDKTQFIMPILALVAAFVGRLAGYGIDRIIEYSHEKK